MTKIAIISDIHGNKTALEAVFNDIRKREIERIFCLGDLIGKGPQSSVKILVIEKGDGSVVINIRLIFGGVYDTRIA